MPLDTTNPINGVKESDSVWAPYADMSPSLLSEQSTNEPNYVDRRSPDWWSVGFNKLESRMAGMRSWRWTWWAQWMVLGEFFLPRRAKWFIVANNYNRGRYLNDSIIDSTGTIAMNVCASGMWNGLTNPARPWFKLAVGLPWVELDEEAKQWFEDTEARLYTVFAQSNFYESMAQAFQDVTVFGTSPIIIYEDAEDAIRCYVPCVGEYFLAVGARLSVDTLYREFTLTVTQIVEMFQIDNCPPTVRELWNQGGASLDNEFIVAHAIEPNFAMSKRGGAGRGDKISMVPGKYPFREVYWLRGTKTPMPLSVRGFNELPFVAMRWSTVSNDPYGRSPCMDALGDVKQIQLETLRKAESIEKGVRPPMGADPEMKNEPASILPGNITYVSSSGSKKGFWSLFDMNPTWLQHLTADIEKVSMRIKEALFVPLFMAITQMAGVQPRNELELTKRDLERLQVLGPFIERFENECAGPAIKRVLAIMQRRGMLRPLPKSLQGIPLKIDYQSIMRTAQKSSEAVGMKDFMATLGAASAGAKGAGVPDPARVVNWDKWVREYGALTSVPNGLLFTDDEVKEHDRIRMQEMAKAQQQAQAPAAAKAAIDGAQVLSKTEVPGGNALSYLLGGSPNAV